jgi:hypothetical protein
MNDQPFVPQKLEEERDKDAVVLTIRLNKEELALLQEDMRLLEQPKQSTAIKQLMGLGRNVLHDNLMGSFFRIIFANKRRNQRQGIVDYEL